MRYLSLIILFIISSNLFSQSQTHSEGEASKSITISFDLGTLKSKTTSTNASVYLTEEWSKYEIILKNDEVIKEVVSKYDIKNNRFEIRHKGDVKVLSGNKIAKFSQVHFENGQEMKRVFKNVQNFEVNSETIYKRGFVEELYAGNKKGVYKYHYINVIAPNYNMTLNTGSKTEQYVRASKMVVFDQGDFTKLESSKKKNLKLFDESTEKVSAFVKENKLSFKSEQDLIKIFMFYDELENHM